MRLGMTQGRPVREIRPGQYCFLDERFGIADLSDLLERPDLLSGIAALGDKDAVSLQPQWEAPLPFVRNVFGIGKNFPEHVDETLRAGDPIKPKGAPIFFSKATTSHGGPGSPIWAWESATQLDYEAELAVVIGRRGINIAAQDAWDYVFGYTLVNDLTDRDLQSRHVQWFRGKSLDGFCPIGPILVTRDELPIPPDVDIRCYVNGELRQNFNTSSMYFDIPTMIAELSRGMTLLPGDIICTGTGAGGARSLKPPRFLQPGDTVRIECDAIGVLENPVERPREA